MSESEIIALALTLAFCILAYAIPVTIFVTFWRLNADYRRIMQLIPAFAGRYDLHLQRDQQDWYARWPCAVGECGGRAISLAPFRAHWHQRHRGLRLEMAANMPADTSLLARFPADLSGRWQDNQEENWSPLVAVPYTSRPPELGDWLFVENELLDLKLEEHLGRLYQQEENNLEFTLHGETGRLWIAFPDTLLTVDQLVIATQILEKFAAALESNHEIGEFSGSPSLI